MTIRYRCAIPICNGYTIFALILMSLNICREGMGFPVTSGPGMDFTRDGEFEPGMDQDRGMVKNGAMAIGAVGLAAVAYKALKGKKCKKSKYGHNSSRELEFESNAKDYSEGFGDEFY